MADTYNFIVLVHLFIVSNTFSYSIQNRVSSILDNRQMLWKLISNSSLPISDECDFVQFTQDLQCSFIPNDYEYYKLFEGICKQHQLCYACGTIHGVSKRKCNTLSRIYAYEQCMKNPQIVSDCLQRRSFALTSLQKNVYRLSEFTSKCDDHCMLNYLYENPKIKENN